MPTSETSSEVRYPLPPPPPPPSIDKPAQTIVTPAPASALAPNLPRKSLAAITLNIVIILGVALVAIIVFTFILSWFDKAMPESILVMGGVALGYLGNAIVNNNSTSA